MKKKRLAYALDEDTATSMVQRSKDDNDIVTYVPYTLRSDVVVEADTTGLNHEELAVTGISFADTINNSTSDNGICQELADSIDRFENLYISDLRRKKVMYGLQRDKLKVINHASKKSCYMMKEATVIPQTLPERQR
ncbi:unnamed protein product [Rhizopus microsporus]